LIADDLYIMDNVYIRDPSIFMYGSKSIHIGKGT